MGAAHIFELVERYVGNPAAQLELKNAITHFGITEWCRGGKDAVRDWPKHDLAKREAEVSGDDADAIDVVGARR